MRVVLNQTWASPIGSGKQGDVVDVPTKTAKQLIAAGAAVKETATADETDSTPPKPDRSLPGVSHSDDQSASEESTSEDIDADAQGEDDDGATDPSATTPSPAEGTSAPRRTLTLGRGKK